jgi:hypothetical protein
LRKRSTGEERHVTRDDEIIIIIIIIIIIRDFLSDIFASQTALYLVRLTFMSYEPDALAIRRPRSTASLHELQNPESDTNLQIAFLLSNLRFLNT